jgi:hypothetical protein
MAAAWLLCVLALAVVCAADRVTLYGRSAVPAPYKAVDQLVNPDTVVTFTIALKQRNLDQLRQALYEVSDPSHLSYGKHWSREKILELVAPPAEHREIVRSWLKEASGNVKLSVDDRGDAFRVTTTIAVAEHLFETKLSFYVDSSVTRALPIVKFMGKFSLPSHIAPYVDMVTGITEFPPKPLTPKVYTSTSGTDHCNTPYTLKRIYNMSDSITVSNGLSTQGPFSHDAHQTKTIGFGETDLTEWQILNDLPQVPVSNVIGDAAQLYGPTDSSLLEVKPYWTSR